MFFGVFKEKEVIEPYSNENNVTTSNDLLDDFGSAIDNPKNFDIDLLPLTSFELNFNDSALSKEKAKERQMTPQFNSNINENNYNSQNMYNQYQNYNNYQAYNNQMMGQINNNYQMQTQNSINSNNANTIQTQNSNNEVKNNSMPQVNILKEEPKINKPEIKDAFEPPKKTQNPNLHQRKQIAPNINIGMYQNQQVYNIPQYNQMGYYVPRGNNPIYPNQYNPYQNYNNYQRPLPNNNINPNNIPISNNSNLKDLPKVEEKKIEEQIVTLGNETEKSTIIEENNNLEDIKENDVHQEPIEEIIEIIDDEPIKEIKNVPEEQLKTSDMDISENDSINNNEEIQVETPQIESSNLEAENFDSYNIPTEIPVENYLSPQELPTPEPIKIPTQPIFYQNNTGSNENNIENEIYIQNPYNEYNIPTEIPVYLEEKPVQEQFQIKEQPNVPDGYKVCPKCGQVMRDDYKLCFVCGQYF